MRGARRLGRRALDSSLELLGRVSVARTARTRSEWLLHLWGKLLRVAMKRWPASAAVRDLSATELVDLVRSDPVVRAMLSQVRPREMTSTAILKGVDRRALVPLAVRLILSASAESASDRSRSLYEGIGLSASERGADSLVAGLQVVQRIPELITATDAKGIMKTCARIADQKIDPYALPGIAIEARITASILLSEHPELDETVAEMISSGKGRLLSAVVAPALQLRREGRTEAVTKYVEAWGPSAGEAIAFGRSCDTRYSATDPVEERSEASVELRVRARRVLLWLRSISPWLVGPGLISLAAVLAWTFDRSLEPEIGYGEALGMLGILVAAHIVSAELSANRLPGVLARYTSTPPFLKSAYSLVVVIIALVTAMAALDGQLEPRLDEAVATGILAGTGAFGVVVYVTLQRLLRRTDPAAAAERYASERQSTLERSGIRLGQIQGDARTIRDLVGSLAYVSLDSSPSVAERRSRVLAPHRGFRMVSQRRLRALGARRRWQSGQVELRLVGSPGTTVDGEDEVGSLVASPDTSISRADLRRGSGVFRTIRSVSIDEAAEAVAALIELAHAMALSGDRVSAERVANSIHAVLMAHLRGARLGRGTEDTESRTSSSTAASTPATPSIRIAVESLVARLSRSDTTAERDVLLGLLEKIVGDTVPSEHAVHLAGIHAGDIIRKGRDEVTASSLLFAAAETALDLGDRQGLHSVMDSLAKHLRTDNGSTRPWMLEAASRLVSAAVWKDYFQAHETWEWYWEAVKDCDDRKGERLLGALRIGAVALLAGNVSLAIQVVLSVRDVVSPAELEAWVRHRILAAREQVISEMYGRYLGTDAEAALADFARFATPIASAVQGASSTESPAN